jgi:THO complex subunit 2
MCVIFLFQIFSDISYSIASLTENEARRYGRFLLGLLETVMFWHSDSEVFERECAQHPGFLTVFRNSSTNPSQQQQITSSSNALNKQEQLDYENYRHVCHKWHYKLTKSFIVCLESEEYLQMRNALIILTKILPLYPKLTSFNSALEKRVEKIKQVEKDKRQDIYTLASVYLGQLRQRKTFMIEESKFHLKEVTNVSKTRISAQQTSNGTNSSSSSLTTTSNESNKPKAAVTNGTHSSYQDVERSKSSLKSSAQAKYTPPHQTSAQVQVQNPSSVKNPISSDSTRTSSSSKATQQQHQPQPAVVQQKPQPDDPKTTTKAVDSNKTPATSL